MAFHTYTISEDLEIRVFVEGQDAPFIYQPHKPDGTSWADEAEARAWVEELIAPMEENYQQSLLADGEPSETPPVEEA